MEIDKTVAPKHPASVLSDKLYPDFTLTTDNCASEPIHRPIAIQSNGHLLVIDTSSIPSLHAVSAQLPACLGHTIDTLWSRPIAHWLPHALIDIVSDGNSRDYRPQSLNDTLLISGISFAITHHRHKGKLTIEFELVADTQVADHAIRTASQAFRYIDDRELLYADATRRIAKAFGYDRVMIYEFDFNQHGSVVGEHKIDSLEPFFGLHYPESDVPKVARDLFLLIKSRAICNVDSGYEPLVFNPALGTNPPYLDLSYSQLRATSPIHIQYLKNMDVAASLTFAIISHGKLWGLVACHHGTPRQVQFTHKLIGEAIVDLLAKRIEELTATKRSQTIASTRDAEKALLEQVILSDNFCVQVMKNASSINELCEADGAALITLEQCVYKSGLAPSNATLIKIRNWLVSEGHSEVFSTNNFTRDIPSHINLDCPIGGMLSSCISALSDSYLLWFRHPVSHTVNWAGDPKNSYSVKTEENGKNVQICPRQSFAKWQIKIEGLSAPWESSTHEMADRVRQGVLKKELNYTAMLIERSNKEFMQMTYAAVHDLQEPLRTQASYLELLKESLEAEDYDELMFFAKRTENAATRMSDLVNDLLSYSRLGSTTLRENVNLTQVIQILQEELEIKLTETKTKLTVGELPTIIGDSRKTLQLMRNLITNAIKYVEPGTVPEISVFAEQDGTFWTLNVKDNGIGIDSKYHSTIFTMFKRLHGKSEYGGSGIGLAICAKVVDLMGAEIGVKSEQGSGSIFWVRFHNSSIVK